MAIFTTGAGEAPPTTTQTPVPTLPHTSLPSRLKPSPPAHSSRPHLRSRRDVLAEIPVNVDQHAGIVGPVRVGKRHAVRAGRAVARDVELEARHVDLSAAGLASGAQRNSFRAQQVAARGEGGGNGGGEFAAVCVEGLLWEVRWREGRGSGSESGSRGMIEVTERIEGGCRKRVGEMKMDEDQEAQGG